MDRTKEIKRMLANGFTYKQVADFYSVSKQAIHEYCKKRGLKRKNFNIELPIVKSEIQLLKESGKKWCQACHSVDIPLIKNGGNGGMICRPCQAEKMKKYYYTTYGKVSMLKSKLKYEKRKKAEKGL